jgi:citrate lyase subunit alpha/citrate CoA-transferase
MKLIKNHAGRLVPTEVNGEEQIPFKGINKHKPKGNKAKPSIRSCTNYPWSGNKVQNSLELALKKAGLKDGMTISTHHHLRDGDVLTNLLFDTIKRMGVKNLRWYPSASFPVHSHIFKGCYYSSY